MDLIERIKKNKEKRNKQIAKCKKCIWSHKQESVIYCPFCKCVK